MDTLFSSASLIPVWILGGALAVAALDFFMISRPDRGH